MTLNEKKAYIREMGKTALVEELVTNGDFDVETAVDYVYDMITLTNAEFRLKYLGSDN